MLRVPFLWLVFSLVFFNSAHSKKMCELSDIECMTKGAQNVYKNVINGVKGLLDPIDPLDLDEVKGELPLFKYRLSNITLFGMKNCQIKQLLCNKEESTYWQDVHCPRLIVNYYYDAIGFLGPAEVDGQGYTTVTLDDYYLIFSGKYGKFISEKDKKLRFFIVTHAIQMEPKGKVIFESKTPLHNDPKISNEAKAYIKKHWMDMEKILLSPTLENLWANYIKGVDIYLRTYPLDEVIPKEDN